MGRCLLITGTSTEVGKTFVSSALVNQLSQRHQKVVYYKPIQTGASTPDAPPDPCTVKTLTPNLPNIHVHYRYCFEPPVTPLVADNHNQIDFNVIQRDIDAYQNESDWCLIEGAGGLMVPVSPQTLLIDWIAELQHPVLLVAHSELGTMNHTLLSIEALQSRQIPVLGVVFNHFPSSQEWPQASLAEKTLLETLRPFVNDRIPFFTCTYSTAFPLKPELCLDLECVNHLFASECNTYKM